MTDHAQSLRNRSAVRPESAPAYLSGAVLRVAKVGWYLLASIALAILAEIHATLNGRDGQSLTTGPVGGLA